MINELIIIKLFYILSLRFPPLFWEKIPDLVKATGTEEKLGDNICPRKTFFQ